MKKFVCPKCGGLIRQWIEYLRTDYHKINAMTGEITKEPVGSICDKHDHMEGLMCMNPACGWFINYMLEAPKNLTLEENKLIRALFIAKKEET